MTTGIDAAWPLSVSLPDEAATVALGELVAAELQAGDTVTLSGEIGAGKTALARAVLRSFVGEPELEVPSPTFTLLQSYNGPRGPVVHADLYRLAGSAELVELGFDDAAADAILLVEWPDRAGDALPADRVDILLAIDGESGGRRTLISGQGRLADRLERAYAIVALLNGAGWGEAERGFMQGDASSRAYERLAKPTGESAVLMISPPRPDGPPVRRGRPYSAIAKLAESVHAFAAMDRGLLAVGFSAPRILAEDLGHGLLLLEDFGSEPVVDADGPIPDRYAEATRLLAKLHGQALPTALPIADERTYTIPPYDLDALMIEVELLLDWYLPHIVGTQPSGSVRAEFGHAWRDTLTSVIEAPQTWTLRDYHSPNLIWLAGRSGTDRVGVLDFQDAVLGHPAYDVASLLQDARVTVPADLELKLLSAYASARRAAEPDFDTGEFAAAYAILGAQRATKILGIFARLDVRDGKPQYLAHLPRIRAYLARNLEHPALRKVRNWFHLQIPNEFAEPEPDRPDEEPVPEADKADEVGSTGAVDETEPTVPSDETGAPAMVLAAGLGQRMRPITDTLPKPLVTIGGQAMIDHALGRLAEAGLGTVVVNVHHLADLIEAHLAGRPSPEIIVSDERDALLETGGGVKRALPLLAPEFVVMNSDSLWVERDAGNITELIGRWRPDDMDALLLLAARDSLGYDGGGDFGIDEVGRLTRRAQGGTAPFVYAGVGVFKAESFADTPEGPFSLNLIFDRAIAAGRLYGHVLDGEWLHIGTPEAIGAAEGRLAELAGCTAPAGP